jgi:hypothetical protein
MQPSSKSSLNRRLCKSPEKIITPLRSHTRQTFQKTKKHTTPMTDLSAAPDQPTPYHVLRYGGTQDYADLYKNIYPTVVQAIGRLGGNAADGRAFGTAALVDAAHLARTDQWPGEHSVEEVVTRLAAAHYRFWLAERGGEVAIGDPASGTDTPPDPTPEWLQPDDLRSTRSQIFTWKKLHQLPIQQREALFADPKNAPARAALLSLLRPNAPATDELPEWAEAALTNLEGYYFWKKTHDLESRQSGELPPSATEGRVTAGGVAKYVFAGLLVSTIGLALFMWLSRPKPVGEVFESNFEPPKSIWQDLQQRYAADTSGVERPAACDELFLRADRFYQEKNYAEAAGALATLLDELDLAPCHSDALFFLGVMHLEAGDPEDGLAALSKIENIEAYGEDLYWYQALAFVKMAQRESRYRPIAERAMTRFLENTRDETRRQQGEKMLDELK